MKREQSIARVDPEVLAAFREKKEAIIQEVVDRSLARDDEVAHHGQEAEHLITSGVRFTTRMLDAAMAVGEVALLEDQLTWARDRLPHDGVVLENVLSRFCTYREVVEKLLARTHAAEVVPYLDWMIRRQRELVQQRRRQA